MKETKKKDRDASACSFHTYGFLPSCLRSSVTMSLDWLDILLGGLSEPVVVLSACVVPYRRAHIGGSPGLVGRLPTPGETPQLHPMVGTVVVVSHVSCVDLI